MKHLLLYSAFSSVVAAAVSQPVLAQDAGEEEVSNTTNVILVTARKREESVQDVPFVVSVLNAEQIQSRGIATVEDVARYTPGLVFDRGISLQDTRPVIRGLPATRGRPPVGVLLDGIDISAEALGNAGGGSLLNLRVLDVERIEVVKGPQSALYGRSAFAGAISYVSKRPDDELSAEMRGTYGSFDTAELAGAISVPLSDSVGVRFNGAHSEFGGDYVNPNGGGRLNAFSTTGGAVAFEVDKGSDFNAFVRLSYSDYENSQPAMQSISGFVPGNVSRPGAGTPEAAAVAAGVAGGALTSALTSNVPPRQTLRFTGVTPLSLDPRTGSDLPGLDGDLFTATVNLSADLGPFEAIYNFGYVRQNDRLIYDGDFFGRAPAALTGGTAEPLNVFDYVDFDNNLNLISNEVRLQDLSDGPLRWAIGGLHWYSDTQQESRSLRAISGFPLTGSPATAAGSAATLFANSIGNVPASPFRRKIDSLSVYALLEYDLTSKLTVSAEARYIDEETSVVRSNFVQTAFAPLPAGFANPVQRASVSDDAFVPRFAVNYRASDDLLIYASAAKGFKPAGVSELDFASSLQDSQFKAETVWNYEVGFKSSFADGQVVLNAAAFFMDWRDKQVSQLLEDPGAPSGFRASVVNAGRAEVLGLDASIVLQPDFLEGLTLDAAYTYLDTEYTDFTVFSNSNLAVTEASNCTVVQVGGRPICEVSYNGNRLERAPRHQVAGNLNYRAALSDDLAVVFGASAQYLGSRFLQEVDRLVLPSYVNVDMQLGLEFRKFTLQGYVTNLTGDDSVRTAQNNFDLATFGRGVQVYAPPRRIFGVRLAARF
jgi:outer membrane receptor protein involved in Fe transport